jgi:hypothetical protein
MRTWPGWTSSRRLRPRRPVLPVDGPGLMAEPTSATAR